MLYVELVEKINDCVLGDFLKKIVFFMIGVEVVENVIKIVCVVIGCLGVIVFLGGFYGCMMMGMVLIGKVVLYKLNFGLFLGDVFYVLYLNVLYGVMMVDLIKVIEMLFKVDIDLKCVVVIIFELV